MPITTSIMIIHDIISIAREFTDSPGAGYTYEGPWSGEQFINEILRTRFEKALKENYVVQVNLDGVIGYPCSFLAASFGVLSAEKGREVVLKHLNIVSSSPGRIARVIEIINGAAL